MSLGRPGGCRAFLRACASSLRAETSKHKVLLCFTAYRERSLRVGEKDPSARRYSTPMVTSVDLMNTVAGCPALRPRSVAASLVTEDVTT